MRVIKILGGVVVVLIIALIGALVWVGTQDFSQYQGRIAEEVRRATGRNLAIKGRVDAHVGLMPTVSMTDVTFQNAGWGSRPDMVTVRKLEVELRLFPLVFGDIHINRIVLNGADILLERDKQGRANWDFAAADAGAPSQPAPAQPQAQSPAPAGAAGKPASLPRIDKIAVTDSTVVFRDAAAQRITTTAIKRLDASGIGGEGSTNVELDATLNGTPLAVTGQVGALQALLAGGPSTVDLRIRAAANTIAATGQIANGLPDLGITAEGGSLAELTPLVGAALPALGPYSLQGKLVGRSQDSMTLNVAKLKVGSSEIVGEVAIGREKDGRPRLAANLSSPRLNMKDFLKDAGKPAASGEGEGKAGDGRSADGRVFPGDPLPVQDLRLANATMTLKAGEIVNDEVRMQNLVVPLTLTNGVLNVKPTASAAGGTVNIDLTLNAAAATPQLSLTLAARQVAVGDLLKMLQDSDVIRGGPADVDLRVRGTGNSVRAIMASLNGTSSVVMGGGQLNNRRLAFLTADFMRLLTQGGGDTTQINCAVSRFNIVNGVATSQALVIDTANLAAQGRGTVDLGSEGLDLVIVPETRQPALASLAVPIRIGGTLASPKASPDIARGAMEAGKNAIGGYLSGGTGGLLGALAGGIGKGKVNTGNACAAVAAGGEAKPAPKPKSSDPIQEGLDAIKRLFR